MRTTYFLYFLTVRLQISMCGCSVFRQRINLHVYKTSNSFVVLLVSWLSQFVCLVGRICVFQSYFQPNFVVSTKIRLIRISADKIVQPAELVEKSGWGIYELSNRQSVHNDLVTCKTKLFRNNFEIASVFYFTCNHVWWWWWWWWWWNCLFYRALKN